MVANAGHCEITVLVQHNGDIRHSTNGTHFLMTA